MKYFNRYNSFKELTKSLNNIELKVLGTILYNKIKYQFFNIEINKQIKYPFLCLSAAIHGSEPSGVTGILKWLEESNIKSLHYKIFPIVNPYGYNFFRRTNHNRINLNREFNKTNPEREIKLIKRNIKNDFFDVFISFHENSAKEKEDFYIYSYPNNNSIKLSQYIIKNIEKEVKIDQRLNIDGYKAKNGLIIDNMGESFEYYVGKNHAKSSICIEIPSKLSIKYRTKIVKNIINLSENYLLKR